MEIDVALNQQQVELLDRTVGEQGAASRSEVIARALGEYYDAHFRQDGR